MSNNNVCTIYIVRHGESETNILETRGEPFRADLEKSSKLTEKGRQQAKNLAEKFKDIQFDAIFSSDYLRAQETAKILKLERKIAIASKEEIREKQFGSWAGRWHLMKNKVYETIQTLPEEDKMKFVFDDVEIEEDVYNRFRTFLTKIATEYIGKTILVVCHGTIMRTLLWKLGWATYHQLPSGTVENTAYYIVVSNGKYIKLKEVNGINKK